MNATKTRLNTSLMEIAQELIVGLREKRKQRRHHSMLAEMSCSSVMPSFEVEPMECGVKGHNAIESEKGFLLPLLDKCQNITEIGSNHTGHCTPSRMQPLHLDNDQQSGRPFQELASR